MGKTLHYKQASCPSQGYKKIKKIMKDTIKPYLPCKTLAIHVYLKICTEETNTIEKAKYQLNYNSEHVTNGIALSQNRKNTFWIK